MADDELKEIVSVFVKGLLKKAKVTHAGNCLLVSQILQSYLMLLLNIKTKVTRKKVLQGSKRVNHYYLTMRNGKIIDATASQFIDVCGERMPKVIVGDKPHLYTL